MRCHQRHGSTKTRVVRGPSEHNGAIRAATDAHVMRPRIHTNERTGDVRPRRVRRKDQRHATTLRLNKTCDRPPRSRHTTQPRHRRRRNLPHFFKSSTLGAAALFPAPPAAAAAARPEAHPGNVPASQASSNELSVSPNTFREKNNRNTQIRG